MSYVITGASGQLGRSVTAQLLERVDPGQVVAVTRRPEQLADLAGRGAAVRFGDFDQPDSLVDAFAGGERLLLISADQLGGTRVRQHLAAIDAARTAGVRHISYTSLPNPVADNPFVAAHDHRATEEALAASGLAHTSLRNALYADLRVTEAHQAAETGTLVTNLGAGRTAFVTRDDCAAAAVAVLTGGPEHDGISYDITGAALVGATDLAAAYGRLSGRDVEVVDIDDDALTDQLSGHGLPEPVARMVASIGTAIREGYLDQVSDAVATLVGRPPAPWESVLSPA